MPEHGRARVSSHLLRPMRPADLPGVMAVQRACYGAALVEPEAVLWQRLAVAPDTCHVAVQGGAVRAYCAGYRSHRGAVTALNAPFAPVPGADTLYVHDLAVHPDAHGQGLGGRLAAACLALGRRDGLAWSALVAVQDAAAFWQRLGFGPAAGNAAALGTYGDGARYLVRRLG